MIRRLTSLRLYHRIVRTISSLSLPHKHFLWAGIVTAVALTGGTAVLSRPSTEPRSNQNGTPVNQSSSHPLLGTDEQLGYPEKSGLDHSRSAHADAADEDKRRQNENDSPAMTSVTINGESIEVPPQGSSRQTIINADGSLTEVNVQSEQTSSGGRSTSNLTINSHLRSNSSSSGSINSRITISH